LDAASVGGRSRVKDGFDLVVFVFAFNDLGGWLSVVRSVFGCFVIWGKEGVVEYWVNSPLFR
jgi:hypothetical protein